MMANQRKKIIGFLLLLSLVFLVLQFSSMIVKKRNQQPEKVALAPGATFMPKTQSPMQPKQVKREPEKESEAEKKSVLKDTKPVSAKLSEPEKKNVHKKSNTNMQQKKNVPEIHSEKQTKPAHSIKTEKQQQNLPTQKALKGSAQSPEQFNKKQQKSKKPKAYSIQEGLKTISLSNAQFISLDLERDAEIDKGAIAHASKKKDGMYGWGILSDYENPDIAHKALGGIPFAINSKKKEYYKINLSQKKVQPAFAMSAYSTIGVDANDPLLRNLVSKARQEGVICVPPDSLRYYYLFSVHTEKYIHTKVVNTFEWYVKNAKKTSIDPQTFRKQARLRIAVWRAKRLKGGQMGIVVPIYFDYQQDRLFLPSTYYLFDYETAQLGIQVNQDDYR